MAEALLAVDDLHTYYGESHVLQGVSFDVPKGSVVALLGRNGAGKTTTLRSLMGLTPPREGSIRVFGTEVARLPAFRIAALAAISSGDPSASRRPWSSTVMRSARWNTTRMSCSISTIV